MGRNAVLHTLMISVALSINNTQFPETEAFNIEMVNFGPGGFQWLVQTVPLTALVCAATIALILLLVRIVAQSLASQPRRIKESLPSSFMVHSSGPTSPFLARDYDYSHPTSPLFNTPVPARALDFSGSSPTNFYNKELPCPKMYSSFETSPISRHMESLTETLSLEVASKAQHCGDDPRVVQLCVNLVQHYNLDVDHRLPPRGLSIFHQVGPNNDETSFNFDDQACRSGSPHLVASLVQLANISRCLIAVIENIFSCSFCLEKSCSRLPI